MTRILAILFCSAVIFLFAVPRKSDSVLDPRSTRQPDRIMLTWNGDPTTTQAVTWRTDPSVGEAVAQIAAADASPTFVESASTISAETTWLESDSGSAHYHTVTFENLEPNTLYAYRVGDGDEHWSAWDHFRTASDSPTPFSFIYVGDAQNDIFSLWSRAIREAYSEAPRARFIIHAGDLVNRAHRDVEWQEWFDAAGWIHRRTPSIPVPGNHEYHPAPQGGGDALSIQWRPQFSLPRHSHRELDETTYVVDFQGLRVVALNSNRAIFEQAAWIDSVLSDNPNVWTVATFHHPIFSAARGRDNAELRNAWKPLFDEHRVDLVLQGHDHAYGRGHNVPEGIRTIDDVAGTVYVVSVSGPKMYRVPDDSDWRDRTAENTQLFQVVDVSPDTLSYRAVTVTGDLYDTFLIVRGDDGVKRFFDRADTLGPERRTEG
jgi:hypothetical protein